MTVETNAQPDDGKLDVYSLEVPHWWHLLALAPSLRRGTQGSWKHVRAFSATELKLTTRRPHDVTPMASSSRSEEHTSELQSLMRISYAVFCLKNTTIDNTKHQTTPQAKH